MPDGLMLLLIFIAGVIVWTIARVVQLNRRSEEQWRETDKSKLREWQDDDDWDS